MGALARDIAAEPVGILGKTVLPYGDRTFVVIPYKMDFLYVSCHYHSLDVGPLHFLGVGRTVGHQQVADAEYEQDIEPR